MNASDRALGGGLVTLRVLGGRAGSLEFSRGFIDNSVILSLDSVTVGGILVGRSGTIGTDDGTGDEADLARFSYLAGILA